jgi:peptide/nickel transport system ATP-binding protein
MTPILDIDGLEVSIPLMQGTLRAVRGISLSVGMGETVGIVGESGCGKSLTALAIMGLLPRQANMTVRRFVLDGEDLSRAKEAQLAELRGNRIAMIFQEPMTALNPTLRIGLQLGEVLVRHRGASVQAARERAVYLLRRVGISDPESRLQQYPHELSGGLRQRVMIAMALMCGPKLIVADEPTTALDVTIQAQILNLLQELKGEIGTSLVLISHDLGVISRVADRVIVMYAGEIVEQGTRVDVLDDPRHPYTRSLLDCLPRPGVHRRGSRLGAIPGVVPSLLQDFPGCAFKNRCRFSIPDCSTIRPVAVGEGGHTALCLRADELAGQVAHA